MKTIIDQCYDISLEKVDYFNEGELKITLVELKLLKEPKDVTIGEVTLENNYPVEETEDSRIFLVKFENAIFFQVLDESYVNLNKDEKRDTDGIIQIISNSKYQQYIDENFGWYKEVVGEGIHYRVLTSGEVIDVISYKAPVIETI